MKILRSRNMFIGVGCMILSAFGCTKDPLPDPQASAKVIVADTVKTVIVSAYHTILVANPGTNNDIQPNLLIAYNSAKEGDMIVLPAGTFSFSKSILFTKIVSLKGAGRDLTILYRPETMSDASLNSQYFFKWDINRDSSSHLIISDFTLKSKKPAGLDNLNGSLAQDFGISINKAVDFIITNCRFENFGYAAVNIQHKDNLARGLIYNNQFYHNFKGDGLSLGYGVCIYGDNLQWVNSANFGSNNFIFIEDNTFEYHRHSVASGGCALYVARYNTIKNNLILNALDMHYARGGTLGYSNYFSARAAEAYNNSIVNTKYEDGITNIVAGDSSQLYQLTNHAIDFCGGESVIHDNYISGFTNAIRLESQPSATSGTTYPIPFQIGYNSGSVYKATETGNEPNAGDGDSYIWNNTFKYYKRTNPDNTYFEKHDLYNLITESRDYHLSAKPGYTAYIYPHPLRK